MIWFLSLFLASSTTVWTPLNLVSELLTPTPPFTKLVHLNFILIQRVNVDYYFDIRFNIVWHLLIRLSSSCCKRRLTENTREDSRLLLNVLLIWNVVCSPTPIGMHLFFYSNSKALSTFCSWFFQILFDYRSLLFAGCAETTYKAGDVIVEFGDETVDAPLRVLRGTGQLSFSTRNLSPFNTFKRDFSVVCAPAGRVEEESGRGRGVETSRAVLRRCFSLWCHLVPLYCRSERRHGATCCGKVCCWSIAIVD